MKHATLTILLLVLLASLALSAGNYWRNERPLTGVSGTGFNKVIKSALASSGEKAVWVFTRSAYYGSSPVKWQKSTNGGVTWTSEAALTPSGDEVMWGTEYNSNRPLGVYLNGTTIEVIYAGFKAGEGNGIFYLLSTNFGTDWSTTKIASAPNAYDAIYSVAISHTTSSVTNIVWTYHNDNTDYMYIKHRRKTSGGWDDEQTIATYSGGSALHADVDGKVDDATAKATYAVWNEPSGDIWYVKSTNEGSSWGSVTRLEDTNGSSLFPAVKLNSSKTGFVAWENGGKIWTREIGSQTNHSEIDDGYGPRLVCDGTDTLFVTYSNLVSSNYKVKSQKSVDGYNWTSLGFIQEDAYSPNGNLRCPDVAAGYTDGTMRLFIWNGYRPSPVDNQELWLKVMDLGKPAAPTDLQAVKFCSDLIMSYVQVTYTATTALDDSGYNIYRATPNCLGTFSKLNGDIVTVTTYYDFNVPQGTSECDPYCACYKARAVDLALNEGGDSNTSEVGACDSRAMQPAILIAAVQLGQASPSPYTQRRAGYLSWGTGKKADVDPERLEYTIRGLDPKAWYVLDFGYYAPDEGRIVAVKAGDVVLHGPKSIPEEQICVPFLLPKKVYANGTLTFAIERVDGPNAMLGKFRLWKMPDKFHGGPQSAGEAARSMVQPYLAPPRPNPSTGEVFLGYWLPKEGETTLRIYNTAGQMVREIDSGTKNAGAHYLVWDGKNTSGQRAPNGVYLVRLVSGSVAATQKVTILR